MIRPLSLRRIPFVIFIVTSLLLSIEVKSQNLQKPSTFEISISPDWVKAMYSETVSAYKVDSLYNAYFRINPFQKSYHSQYYKRWRKRIQNRLDLAGNVIPRNLEKETEIQDEYLKKQRFDKSSDWSIVGPLENHGEAGTSASGQANIYSLAICTSQPNVMYSGTEPGEVYKSTDTAKSWKLISSKLNFGSGVTAISVHANNPEFVIAGGNGGLFLSTNGGINWTQPLVENDLGVNEIFHHPGFANLIFAATDKGLFRSADSGKTWQNQFGNKTYDIKPHPVNPRKLFLIRNNPSLKKAEFYISPDAGLTWNISSVGWYNSTDPNRNDGGARLAISETDTNRIYAYLIGEAKANDSGFIGLYRSDDGGLSWTLPNGPPGGPYSASHPNLAVGTSTWNYHQGFYNCALMVSPFNPDHILIGGLNLWKSDDGGTSFEAVSGYAGGPLSMHVDNQDFRTQGTNGWISTDGGIYFSTDFFQTQPEFRMKGLHASEYWGFGSGWNEDVLVGGLYHNGNLAYHENYGAGKFLELGGGEASTGYVNPGKNRRTYFSDIKGKTIPLNLDDPIGNGAFGVSPNESYFAAESSEMEFHPHCYQIAYVGKDNAVWKTTDGGGSFLQLFAFGTNIANQVKYIEICAQNPKVIYLTQQSSSGGPGKLWKTTNEGVNWNSLTLPAGNSRRMLITSDPKNENRIWLAYPDGSNTNKIFTSSNGGQNWTNLSSPALNNESIQSLVHIAGTNGGIYAATNKSVYYRTLANAWQIENSGLPVFTNGNILRPFYRDGKIRLATYGKGIWQSPFTEQGQLPVARITVDKLEQINICKADSFYFEDYSFLNHNGATWQWTFPTGQPSSSQKRNPSVFFPQDGTHLAILKIKDGNGVEDVDSIYIRQISYNIPGFILEGFENNFLPAGWIINNADNGAQWMVSNDCGGFGGSAKSTIFDNYNYDSKGSFDEFVVPLNPGLVTGSLKLFFDVAYARWGSANSDTLVILASTDCGLTFQQLYRKGGTNLATSPDFQSFFVPNSTQWRTDSINLSGFSGADKVLIAFRNIGRFGNALYLDNLRLGTPTQVSNAFSREKPAFFPNPVFRGACMEIQIPEPAKISIFNMKGQKVKEFQSQQKSSLEISSQWEPGVYSIQVSGLKSIWNQRIVVK